MELSKEELALVAEFRQQMGEPTVERQQIEVIPESLGSTPQGHKIQYKPGEGKDYMPAPRGAERYAARAKRVQEAMEAAQARLEKGANNLVKQVEDMKRRINGRNATDTVIYMESLNPHDREIAALAEELTQNRTTVLRGAGLKVSNKTRDAYQLELEAVQEAAKG